MRKAQIGIVRKHILRRFLNFTIVGMNHINRQEMKVEKIGDDVVQEAIDELIREGFLETHKKERISINPRMIKTMKDYLERF